MPLNRPALSLGTGPRGVQDARRWVVSTCRDIGRPELCECAELGVSELVTNALLHGQPPFSVRVRGTAEHPRVEVRDGSLERPQLPSEADEEDDLLLTFGRGLSIVARCSDAWGAEMEEDGKVVWFAPARTFAEDDGVPGVITGEDELPLSTPENPVRITVRGVPLDLYTGFQHHFRELRREVRLLSLAHQSDYPLARELSELFAALDRQLRAGVGLHRIDEALAEGAETTDLDVLTAAETTRVMARFIDVLDLADEFCRQQRLLSLARSDEQRRFQQWYLGEYVRQGRGEPATPWQEERVDEESTAGRRTSAS